jgi:hypothetical protein
MKNWNPFLPIYHVSQCTQNICPIWSPYLCQLCSLSKKISYIYKDTMNTGSTDESDQQPISEVVEELKVKGKNRKCSKTALDTKREKAKANLAKGRAIRMANLKKKKEIAQYTISEPDSDPESESDSAAEDDFEELVLSKKKKNKLSKKVEPSNDSENLKQNVDQLKSAVSQLIQIQTKKKKAAAKKRKTSPKNTTKIVMLPSVESHKGKSSGFNGDLIEALKSTVLR